MRNSFKELSSHQGFSVSSVDCGFASFPSLMALITFLAAGRFPKEVDTREISKYLPVVLHGIRTILRLTV